MSVAFSKRATERKAHREPMIVAFSTLRAYEPIVPAVRKIATQFKVRPVEVCRAVGMLESNIPGIVAAVEGL
jgi:hypothetical protein